MSDAQAMQAPVAFDTQRCFVRVTGERGSFVEFEFAVGEPELFIEMILTHEAFEDFCRERKPERLPAADGARDQDGETPEGEFAWRLSDARQRHWR